MNRRSFLSKFGALLTVGGTLFLTRAQDQEARKSTINRAKCVGCGDCIRACPVNAISLDHGKAVVDQGKCVGCRLCVKTCSYGAPR